MAVLRKLGKLAGVLLDDQLARGRTAYASDLTRQRQEEVYRQNIADKVMTNLAPKLASGEITPESIAGFDAMPEELQSVLRAHASTAPSMEQRSAAAMAPVYEGIDKANTPEALGSLGQQFETMRTAKQAKRLPVDLNDITNLGNTFNAKADVLGNAAASKQEQATADQKANFDLTHGERPQVKRVIGADGKPKGMEIFDKATGAWRPVSQVDNLTNADVTDATPQWNNGVPQIPGLDQARLEQQGRAVVLRTLSSRTGNFGIEDQKVNQATHLRSLLDQTFDPRTGQYNIKQVPLKELAMGVARLLSPTGQVGIELMKEFVQPTLAGDFSSALTYATGTPINATSQDVVRMYKELLDRQAEQAEFNRENAIDVMKDALPTELDDEHKAGLLSALTRLTYYTKPNEREKAAATTPAAPRGAAITPEAARQKYGY